LFAAGTVPTLVYYGLIGGTVLGLAICALAWSRRLPAEATVDIGLIFQVLAAFCIAAIENSNPLIAQGWVRGISGFALWTAFFVLVVPSSLGKTTLVSESLEEAHKIGLVHRDIKGTGSRQGSMGNPEYH
jgi:hypothetical protein